VKKWRMPASTQGRITRNVSADQSKTGKSNSEYLMPQVERMFQVIWWVRTMLILRREHGTLIVKSHCSSNHVMSYSNCSKIDQNRLWPLLILIQFKRIDHILAAVLFHFLAATRTLVFRRKWVKRQGCQSAPTIMGRDSDPNGWHQVQEHQEYDDNSLHDQ
jgi:hypothetical protein